MISIEGKKIFVTGGAGFIGSTLIGHLIENNEVVIYDNLSRNSLQLKSFANHPNLTLVEGDVLDATSLKEAIKGAQYVIHCAAIAGIDTVVKLPVTTMRVNMIGSANLLEAVAQTDSVERCVLFSTSEVFGQHAVNSSETDTTVIGAVGEARWTYAVSKLAEEHLAFAYHSEQKVPVAVVRPFNVYGPGQVGEGALRTFILKAIKGDTIEIHGDGSQIRAWCYVDDMVAGVICCLTDPKAVGESFNIGNKKTVLTIHGLANTVVRVLNSKSDIEYIWKDYADVELRIPSVVKAKEILDFEAEVEIEDGIVRTAQWYKQNNIVL